ncbi:glycosyltransferase family 32 protein [Fibrobacter intestinalis]|uniref:Glycosyltransferase sugar-binding region containing DXD motif-containing protein n=1 Tax=Fibrobacter intestinalis TaxID=28122 RepID=A0A1T4K2K5_9BACT|nr:MULTISPECIES: glycosyltransferase [Fibrobacter]PBC74237.1 glycosyl transferase-like sugar-binding protein [Fibrobacter sp. NR9]SJZ36674.1 Glycosyltransferase sugar-binding region containing DXD motif-containing protein [Fibrobacter intestinalis]
MIPKVIHYCWFGHNELPPLAKKCIASWRKFFPDYEIKEWNEDNFDVNQIPYTAQAYRHKKYAFVSDYARFKILYEHGGIYFDTDVEVIKPMNDILAKGAFFGLESSCQENHLECNPGLGFACPPHFGLLKEMIDFYQSLNFETASGKINQKTIVEYFSEQLLQKGFISNLEITEFENASFYPPEYFCPKPSEFGKINLTENTRTIHQYAATWIGQKQRFANLMIRIFGKKLIMKLWNLVK